MRRCAWVGKDKPHYEAYHDEEWGVPVHDDRIFMEMLVLEGAQAGLSWENILKRRNVYRQLFKNFNSQELAMMKDAELEALCQDPRIIRNKRKIFSARNNAKVFCNIQEEFGSFDRYVWPFVGGVPIVNRPETLADVPAQTKESQALSRDLKKRGMSFVGPTIIYAFMQATGLVNDHTIDCSWAAS